MHSERREADHEDCGERRSNAKFCLEIHRSISDIDGHLHAWMDRTNYYHDARNVEANWSRASWQLRTKIKTIVCRRRHDIVWDGIIIYERNMFIPRDCQL